MNKLKNFLEYLKEEVDVEDIDGLDDDFIKKSKEWAEKNLDTKVDSRNPGDIMPLIKEIMDLMSKSKTLLLTDKEGDSLNKEELDKRISKLEKLVFDVVTEEYGSLLEQLPVYFKIKLLPDGIEDPNEGGEPEAEKDIEVTYSISKAKILNMITQGEGKSTKSIISYSDLIDKEFSNIFGEKSSDALKTLSELGNVASKLDWTIPIQDKLPNSGGPGGEPGGGPSGGVAAGSVNVYWDDQRESFVIESKGVDFGILLHETVKGIYRVLSTSSIKPDKETAEKIKAATSTLKDEFEDFRYGQTAQLMFNQFVNSLDDVDKYENMRSKVFGYLATDSERGGLFTDEEFINITKSLFSCFSFEGEDFVLDKEKFEKSLAKKELNKVVEKIIEVEEKYKEELREWELGNSMGGSDTTDVVNIEEEPEVEEELSKLSQRELNDLINKALDERDFDRVKELSDHLKEGKQIYLNELKNLKKIHKL